MTPDYATFAILYPELITTNPSNQARIELLLAEYAVEFPPGSWGKCWAPMVLLYVAHLVALGNARAAAANGTGVVSGTGVLVSGSEEGISFAFAAPSNAVSDATSSWLYQTPYGQEFLAKRRGCLPKAYLSW